jgi:hypothetical protein
MLLALRRLGHETAIDQDLIFRLGDQARRFFAERGNDPTHFVSGIARVHSRNVPAVLAAAHARGKQSRGLLYHVGVGAQQRGLSAADSFPSDLIDQASAQTSDAGCPNPSDAVVTQLAKPFAAAAPTLAQLCDALFVRSAKSHKPRVLHLVPGESFPHKAPLAWETGDVVGLTCAATPEHAQEKVASDRLPDLWLVDHSLAGLALPSAPHRFYDSFDALVADAVTSLALAWLSSRKAALWLASVPEHLGNLLLRRLTDQNVEVHRTAPPTGSKIVIASALDPNRHWLERVAKDDLVIVTGPTAKARAWTAELRERGALLLRPPLAPVIAARASTVLALQQRLTEPLHATPAGSLSLVDALVAPAPGDIVVDSMTTPTRALDGTPTPEEALVLARLRATSLLQGKGAL